MKSFVVSIVLMCAMAQGSASAQDAASAKMAESVIREWPAGVVTTENKPGEWAYEEGVLLDGMAAQGHVTANNADFKYIKDAVDKYVTEEGAIKGYKAAAHSLDDIEMGRAVLEVYRMTQQPKYHKAAKFVHDQLAAQPRTASGGTGISRSIQIRCGWMGLTWRSLSARLMRQPFTNRETSTTLQSSCC